jgi:nucleolin
MLYERLLRNSCLDATLWKEYIEYLLSIFGSNQMLSDTYLKACRRAVRNCPWQGLLWCLYIQSLEQAKHSTEEIEKVFEEGLIAGLQTPQDAIDLFQALIDHYTRKLNTLSEEDSMENKQKLVETLRATCERAVTYAQQYFQGQKYDEQILRHWATLEGRKLGDKTRFRDIYEQLLKSYSRNAFLWLEWAELEWNLKETDQCRKILKRACNSVAPEELDRIVERWVVFERMEGDLEQFKAAASFSQRKMNEAYERAEAMEVAMTSLASKGKKRKAQDRFAKQRPRKQQRTMQVEQQPTTTTPSSQTTDTPMELTTTSEPTTQRHSIFISNLPYSIQEQDLREAFNSYGEILEIRIPEEDGKPKGFGFVDFATSEAVEKALERNETTLKDRVIRVERSVPKTERGPKHSEKCTLFVTNLPYKITREELEKLFSEKGKVKDIRMRFDANKAFRGFAYVEMEDIEGFNNGLKLNQKTVNGRIISVKASAPPPPKTRQGDRERSEKIQSQPKGYYEPKRERAKKTQTDTTTTTPQETKPQQESRQPQLLVPRSLALGGGAKKERVAMRFVRSGTLETTSTTTPTEEGDSKSEATPMEEESKAKTNADFRRMFLQGK